ncbi:MAG: ATP-dependent Clp protease proteolytic subunit [Verrucomicrobia bacterium]|nr:ATP-dependent Clp protease proteolytic subunit [Verrucomicrobiota bacterium]
MSKIEYRENPNRAVYVTSDIDSNLVNGLLPQIIKLRLESNDPICLYIDSFGGNVAHMQRLIDLLKTPTQNGDVCKLITIAVGFAASAAADFLALGDYAIAYPDARIYYHGTRRSDDNLTLEKISTLEVELREMNERFALRLALRMFRRMVMLMITAQSESDDHDPSMLVHAAVTNANEFFQRLKKNISPDQQQLINDALERQQKISQLMGLAAQSLEGEPPPSMLQIEKDLLKKIIDFEIPTDEKTDSVSQLHLDAIQDDFIQLRDFISGAYRDNVEELVSQRGHAFLSPPEFQEYEKIDSSDEDARRRFVLDKAGPKLDPLFYLVVSICRCLQKGEHPLLATDAYWLGLVDEVIGSELPSLRTIDELSSTPTA